MERINIKFNFKVWYNILLDANLIKVSDEDAIDITTVELLSLSCEWENGVFASNINLL